MSKPKNEIAKKIMGGKLNRRQLMQTMGAAGLVATTQFVPSNVFGASGQARVLTWSGYDVIEMYPGMDPERLEFTVADDSESMLQKIRAGFQCDTAHPCNADPLRWRRADIIQPIDTSRCVHWNDLFPDVLKMPTTYFEDQHWFAPCEFGDTSIIVNTDAAPWVNTAPGAESINMLFDERLKGKVAMLDSAADSLYLIMIGLGIDVTKMENLTIADVDNLFDVHMENLRPNIRVLSPDPTAIEEAIMSGEVNAAVVWNESSWNTGYPMISPKEGSLTWVCGICIPKGANLDVAYDVINAVQSPECSSFMLMDYGYGHVNKLGYEAISEADKIERGLALDPITHLQNGNFSNEPAPEVVDYIEARWAEWSTGV